MIPQDAARFVGRARVQRSATHNLTTRRSGETRRGVLGRPAPRPGRDTNGLVPEMSPNANDAASQRVTPPAQNRPSRAHHTAGWLELERALRTVYIGVVRELRQVGVVGMATLDPMAGMMLWREQRNARRERRRAAKELGERDGGGTSAERSDVVSLEALRELRSAVRYAIGAYGTGSALVSDASLREKWKSLERRGDAGGEWAHARATEACAKACGIDKEDVVEAEWMGKEFAPSSFVAVDRDEERVVLSVRGTWEFHDALTDVNSESVRFLGGWAHAGMVASAWQIAKRMLPAVARSMKKHPTFNFLITGHSMGGGVAACIAMLMHSEDGDIEAVARGAMSDVDEQEVLEILRRLASCRCVCIAAPSVSSMDLSDTASEYITCVVAGADVIPRLCHASVRRLLRRLNRAAPSHAVFRAVSSALGGRDRPGNETENAEGERANDGSRDVPSLSQDESTSPVRRVPEDARKCQGDWIDVADVDGLELRDHSASDFMVQPGRVIHLDYVRSDTPIAEYKHPTAFTDVVLDPYMMLDHIPGVYQAAVKTIHDRVAAGGSAWMNHDDSDDEDLDDNEIDEEDPLSTLLRAETVRARAREGWRSVRNFLGIDDSSADEPEATGIVDTEPPSITAPSPQLSSYPTVDTSDEDIPDYFGEDARARATHHRPCGRRPPEDKTASNPWDWLASP